MFLSNLWWWGGCKWAILPSGPLCQKFNFVKHPSVSYSLCVLFPFFFWKLDFFFCFGLSDKKEIRRHCSKLCFLTSPKLEEELCRCISRVCVTRASMTARYKCHSFLRTSTLRWVEEGPTESCNYDAFLCGHGFFSPPEWPQLPKWLPCPLSKWAMPHRRWFAQGRRRRREHWYFCK